MKKILYAIVVMMLAAALCVFAMAADTVYVSDNGTGDGSTKETPTNDFSIAIQTVAKGGTIVITDTYTLTEPFTEPMHDGVITVTGGKFVFNHKDRSRYFLNGPTCFEKMTFTYGSANTAKSGMFVCRFFPIVFGEGLTTNSLTVVGGYQDATNEVEKDLDSSITINSGTFATVVGFSRGQGTVTFRGTSNITINGGTVKTVYGASINGSYSGNANIVINGGTITAINTAGDSTRRLNGNAKVTINGGKVATLSVNNVMGHADIYYLGGNVGGMTKSIAEDIMHKVVDGTANLIVRKGLAAHEFKDVFDKATYEDGSAISAAADAAVAVFNVLDKKPTKSNATGAKVYVSNSGNGDGLTPETAISDMKTAFNMLEGIDGTIVLINMVPFDDGGFYEPEHSNKIVITSYDGERYFDGGFAFGHDKYNRYFYSGDTVIENTKIEFTSAPLFIGRWHNVTFGTGLEMVANKAYILGGFQVPTTEVVPTKASGSITVESGSYYCIIGYTRGNDPDGYRQFEGSQTINLLGGEVTRIYGGPAQANAGNNVVINIDGGKVNDYIQVGGDQFYYSNTAEINVKSGSIKTLDMHNVIKSTVVNWTGGTIEEMKVTYGQQTEKDTGNVLFDVATLATDAKYTLNYAGVTPTADMLALFNTTGSGTPVATEKTEVKLTVGSKTAYVNGKAETLSAPAINRGGRVLLPVRFLANAFGVSNDGIAWDGATRTATLKNDKVTIVVTIDAPSMTVNGETVALDSPAIISDSSTYLPVRAIANALGVANENITWDAATNTATLVK